MRHFFSCYLIDVSPQTYKVFRLTLAKRACRQAGVDFQAFDSAHVRYGLSRLNYTNELVKLTRFAQEAKRHSLKPSEGVGFEQEWSKKCDWAFVRRMLWSQGTLDSMSYRLGLGYEIFVELDKQGKQKILAFWGEPMSSLQQIEIKIKDDPYAFDVLVIPDSSTLTGEVFKTVSGFPSVECLDVHDNVHPMVFQRLKVYPAFDLDTFDSDPRLLRTGWLEFNVFIELLGDGTILLNSERFDREVFINLVEGLLVRSLSKSVVIAADDSVPWQDIQEILRLAYQKDADEVYLLPSRLIRGYEPHLNTSQILAWPKSTLEGFQEPEPSFIGDD